MRLPPFERLSQEQDEVCALPTDGRYLVSGPPGTGKTVIALYRSQIITATDRKVSLLTWSRVLEMYCRKAAETVKIQKLTITYQGLK